VTNKACEYGEDCRFLHPGASATTRGSRIKSEQICYALRDNGSCKFGDACRYSHDLGTAAKE